MEISNITKKEIERFLKEGKRFDSRGKFELRDLKIETNVSKWAEGSARVRLGKTDVIAGVKLDMGEPYPDNEEEGTMMTTVELLPLASDRFEYGPPRIEAIETARIIDRGIRESGFIDFKKLCYKKGEKVWTVFIDLDVINDDGNLIDAGALAAIIALKLANFPKYDEKQEKVLHDESSNKGLPLSEKMPISFTFHKIGEDVLIDPTREEETSSDGRITFAISSGKENMINAMQKGGEAVFSIDEVNKMTGKAEKIFKEIFPKIIKEIKGLK